MNILFPLELAYGSSGGPEFHTEILTSYNHNEQRNILLPTARMKYQLYTTHFNGEQARLLVSFFETVQGRAHGFRFRDPLRHQLTGQVQAKANGISSKFQLKMLLGNHYYKITKPVKGSLKIYLNYQEIDNFECDYLSGIVTLKDPPLKDTLITADLIYDIPVRFDNDYLPITYENYGLYLAPTLSLIEIL
ncbi:DUF2460 domain-containing protein [Rickettsiales endosymbiont of Stachyamoeba lipophora]|uniref:DUF2460 domain-containing protein n=1 Tax=Rickettsiales endosymbiont of Stachyamoeba lipophora TaxID=2486578 RepID=UPI0013DDEF91|nr:DUF2460 domain-containing protein [Rickettsiales endosymbiont of Stachyamoeba lipophora]